MEVFDVFNGETKKIIVNRIRCFLFVIKYRKLVESQQDVKEDYIEKTNLISRRYQSFLEKNITRSVRNSYLFKEAISKLVEESEDRAKSRYLSDRGISLYSFSEKGLEYCNPFKRPLPF